MKINKIKEKVKNIIKNEKENLNFNNNNNLKIN